jgi:uncharacterized protein YfbU (UPF0304 family)
VPALALKDKNGIPGGLLRFSDFSANEEGDLFGYLGFFLDRYFGQKYTNLREPGQEMNSHVPMLPICEKMLEVYREYTSGERFIERKLTRDEIIMILKAGYPDSEKLQAL